MRKIILIIFCILLVVGISFYLYEDKPVQESAESIPPPPPPENVVKQDEEVKVSIPEPKKVEPVTVKSPEIVAQNLSIPWEIVFLPDGDMLVTERAGRLLRIGDDKRIIEISGVTHVGEGGLLGLALHPKFRENNFIYVYMTTTNNGRLSNRVERYILNGATLSDRKIIIENIHGANYHDGGRIAFGPDGMLYITTGDAGDTKNSQNKNSLAGKILRVESDGTIPPENPFNNAVYSYGHRNVQGIAWDKSGQLWATEHGRSGVLSGYDEINKIVKSGNYGWPDIQGDETSSGMISPQIHSGASVTWAPSGMEYFRDSIIFVGLRGQSIYTANISNEKLNNLRSYFKGTFGRLRTVVLGPDGMFYIITNNRDSLGKPISSDDRIVRIDPKTIGF